MSFAVSKHVQAPTAAECAVWCRLLADRPDHYLVVAKHSLLEVYSVVAVPRPPALDGSSSLAPGEEVDAQLQLVHSVDCLTRVCSLNAVRLSGAAAAAASRQPALDGVLVTFADAKMVLMGLDPLTMALKALSMHNFEHDAVGPGSGVRATARTRHQSGVAATAEARVDPLHRMVALMAYDNQLVLVPTRHAAGDDDVDIGDEALFGGSAPGAARVHHAGEGSGLGALGARTGDDSAVAGASAASAAASAAAAAEQDARTLRIFGRPRVVDMATVGALADAASIDRAAATSGGAAALAAAATGAFVGGLTGTTRAMTFLHGYAVRPSLAVLTERLPTSLARLGSLAHTCVLGVLACDDAAGDANAAGAAKRPPPLLWHWDGLPSDAYDAVAVPEPFGGVLVLTPNALLHFNATNYRGLALNAAALATVDVRGRYPLDTNVTHNTRSPLELLAGGGGADGGVQLGAPLCVQLEAARAAFLTPSECLLSTRDGVAYLLRFHASGGDAIPAAFGRGKSGTSSARELRCMTLHETRIQTAPCTQLVPLPYESALEVAAAAAGKQRHRSGTAGTAHVLIAAHTGDDAALYDAAADAHASLPIADSGHAAAAICGAAAASLMAVGVARQQQLAGEQVTGLLGDGTDDYTSGVTPADIAAGLMFQPSRLGDSVLSLFAVRRTHAMDAAALSAAARQVRAAGNAAASVLQSAEVSGMQSAETAATVSSVSALFSPTATMPHASEDDDLYGSSSGTATGGAAPAAVASAAPTATSAASGAAVDDDDTLYGGSAGTSAQALVAATGAVPQPSPTERDTTTGTDASALPAASDLPAVPTASAHALDFCLFVVDSLPTLGPATDATVGRECRAPLPEDDAPPVAAAFTELAVPIGIDHTGGIAVMNRSLRPRVAQELRLGAVQGAWFAAYASAATTTPAAETSAAGGVMSADTAAVPQAADAHAAASGQPQQRGYLFLSTASGDGDTRVFDVRDGIAELPPSAHEFVVAGADGRTLLVTTLMDASPSPLLVQVHERGARVFHTGGGDQHPVTLSDFVKDLPLDVGGLGVPEPDVMVVSAHAVDPYVLLRLSDGSVRILTATDTSTTAPAADTAGGSIADASASSAAEAPDGTAGTIDGMAPDSAGGSVEVLAEDPMDALYNAYMVQARNATAAAVLRRSGVSAGADVSPDTNLFVRFLTADFARDPITACCLVKDTYGTLGRCIAASGSSGLPSTGAVYAVVCRRSGSIAIAALPSWRIVFLSKNVSHGSKVLLDHRFPPVAAPTGARTASSAASAPAARVNTMAVEVGEPCLDAGDAAPTSAASLLFASTAARGSADDDVIGTVEAFEALVNAAAAAFPVSSTPTLPRAYIREVSVMAHSGNGQADGASTGGLSVVLLTSADDLVAYTLSEAVADSDNTRTIRAPVSASSSSSSSAHQAQAPKAPAPADVLIVDNDSDDDEFDAIFGDDDAADAVASSDVMMAKRASSAPAAAASSQTRPSSCDAELIDACVPLQYQRAAASTVRFVRAEGVPCIPTRSAHNAATTPAQEAAKTAERESLFRDPSPPRLIPFSCIGGWCGWAVLTPTPVWVMVTRNALACVPYGVPDTTGVGGANLLPGDVLLGPSSLPPVTAFTPFHSPQCPAGLLVAHASGHVHFGQLPRAAWCHEGSTSPGVPASSSLPWLRVPLRAQPYQVRFLDTGYGVPGVDGTVAAAVVRGSTLPDHDTATTPGRAPARVHLELTLPDPAAMSWGDAADILPGGVATCVTVRRPLATTVHKVAYMELASAALGAAAAMKWHAAMRAAALANGGVPPMALTPAQYSVCNLPVYVAATSVRSQARDYAADLADIKAEFARYGGEQCKIDYGEHDELLATPEDLFTASGGVDAVAAAFLQAGLQSPPLYDPVFSVELLAGSDSSQGHVAPWSRMDAFALKKNEHVTAMRELGFVDRLGGPVVSTLVVGTAIVNPRGEDGLSTGRLLAFRVHPRPAGDAGAAAAGGAASWMLQLMCSVDEVAPVTALAPVTLPTGRHLLVGAGRRVHIREWYRQPPAADGAGAAAVAGGGAGGSFTLRVVGFYDVPTWVRDVCTTGPFMLTADLQHSIRFAKFPETSRQPEQLAADAAPQHVAACEMVSHDKTLGLLTVDMSGNARVFNYAAKAAALTPAADAHLGCGIDKLVRHRLASQPGLAGAGQRKNLSVVAGTFEGGAVGIAAVSEELYRRLQGLHDVLVAMRPAAAGIPASLARLPDFGPGRPVAGNFADLGIVASFATLDVRTQRAVARALRQPVDVLLDAIRSLELAMITF